MTIRVLIIEDSPIMRGLISRALSMDPKIDVVGTANDPYEARHAIKQLNPDVITLDVEMPRMNGLDFLEKVMRLRPMPVVMMSTHTAKGADAALQALGLGAVECVGKPVDGNAAESFAELANAIKTAALSKQTIQRKFTPNAAYPGDFQPNGKVVAIGSSTGGVEALTEILQGYPENCPPTLIVQHMPALFTESFATRLNKICAPEISEARDDAPLVTGRVYIAPGGPHHTRIKGGGTLTCRLIKGETVAGHRPSVDVMFDSVASEVAENAVGVILTGMGKDGAHGLKAVRRAGGHTIGQDEASSVIYGMPKVAAEIGAVSKQLPLHEIASAILRACSSQIR